MGRFPQNDQRSSVGRTNNEIIGFRPSQHIIPLSGKICRKHHKQMDFRILFPRMYINGGLPNWLSSVSLQSSSPWQLEAGRIRSALSLGPRRPLRMEKGANAGVVCAFPGGIARVHYLLARSCTEVAILVYYSQSYNPKSLNDL